MSTEMSSKKMDNRRLFIGSRTALTLVLALFSAVGAWAQSETETIGDYTFAKDGNGHLLITCLADWNGLAEAVAAGNTCSGKTFMMTADIGSVAAPVTKPLGRQTGPNKSDRKRFAGTFDGGNHTLFVALESKKGDDASSWFYYSQAYCCPFAFVSKATIRNLHVAGSIHAYHQFASGLVGSSGNSASDGACTIENCHVSAAIVSHFQSTSSNKANHGSFIGVAEGRATLKNCWFDGAFEQEDGGDFLYSGGFLGQNKAVSLFDNCLFNPSACDVTATNSSQFAYDMKGGVIDEASKNFYYVAQFGEIPQGIRVVEQATGQSTTPVYAVDGKTYYIAVDNTPWFSLNEQLGKGGTVTLNADVTATDSDVALMIPHGVTVTLDLNGYTLDRNLSSAKENGFVIKVWGDASLTIMDSSEGKTGTIKGGYCAGHGGGIFCEGTMTITGGIITGNKTSNGRGAGIYLNPSAQKTYSFSDCTISGNETLQKNGTCQGGGLYIDNQKTSVTLNACQIKDNKADNSGGGIYVANGSVTATGCNIADNYAYAQPCGAGIYLNNGSLLLDGCSVTGNTGDRNNPNNGVGVYVKGGSFQVKGNVQVKDNACTKSHTKQNVFLTKDAVITVAGALEADAMIGVTLVSDHGATFTSGMMGKGGLSNFFDDADQKLVVMNETGEARLVSELQGVQASLPGMYQNRYWATFYCKNRDYQLPEGAMAYTAAESNGEMVFYRIGSDSRVIPMNTAVIISSDAAGISLTPLTSASVTVRANELKGSDTGVETSGTCHVFSTSSEGIGFFVYEGFIPAGKAYIEK